VSHEPEAQSYSKLRRRNSKNVGNRHLGKKYFDRLMVLGMVVGYLFLGLIVITIALSIFYRPFNINMETRDTHEQPSAYESVKNLRLNSITKHNSVIDSPKSPEGWIQDIQAKFAHVSQQRKSFEVDRVPDLFIRLPDLEGDQVFTCSSPVITPYVRKTSISTNATVPKSRLVVAYEKDRHKTKRQHVHNSVDPPSSSLRSAEATLATKKLDLLDVKKPATQAKKRTDEKENRTDSSPTMNLELRKRGTPTTLTPDLHTDRKGFQELLTPAFMKATTYEDSKDSGSVSLKEVKSGEL